MQITIAAPHHGQNIGLSNPWTEYVKMLPTEVPVPTMWSEEERIMLVGTSLEVCARDLLVFVWEPISWFSCRFSKWTCQPGKDRADHSRISRPKEEQIREGHGGSQAFDVVSF